ncbi:MAG TPA: hypothetical protein VID51_08970 [Solirubrobacterales bacterium]
MREQLVSLHPGHEPKIVHQDPIAFASAAPLNNTFAEVPEQSLAAEKMSKKTHRRIGRGGKLLVFVRDQDFRARTNPARSVTLHCGSQEIGAIDADGEAGGGSSHEHPPWAGCSYELTPGSWRLRCFAPGIGAVEQAVVVSPGWQTQVFLQRRSYPSSGRGRWPDLADASILMADPGDGFQAGLDDLRGTELARQGLRDRRVVISAKDLRAMVFKKQKNPMLAIYGAHLMIQEKTPDRNFIKRVIKNLRELVGDHPDVMALLLWLSPEAEVGSFAEPPMLLSSWSIIVGATADRPELVPRGSLSAAVAQQIISTGPWLRWRTTQPQGKSFSSDENRIPLGKAVANVAEALPDNREVIAQQASRGHAVEREIISFARQTGNEVTSVSDADVIARLGVPRTVAEDAVQAVMNRLSGLP